MPNQKSKLDLSNFPEIKAWRDKERKDRTEDAQDFFAWNKFYDKPKGRKDPQQLRDYIRRAKQRSWKNEPSIADWVKSDLLYIDTQAAELIYVSLLEEYLFGKHPERYKRDYEIFKRVCPDAYEILDKIRKNS